MAVHAGGSLHQHTPDLVEHDDHSPGGDVFGEIEVVTVAREPGRRPGGRAAHRQLPPPPVGARAPGYVASAHAGDGTVEAMEAEDDRFWLAVQWHPETAADVGLLAGLVRAAATYAAGQGR